MPQEFSAIRLVALDLDGTLLNREGHVTPRTRAALQAAVDKGVYIVPATGRPLASLPPEVAQLPGIRYVITCNGAAVWDLGTDPVGAVYSRYSNAKEHRTSTPVCLLHSLMPVETAREAFAVCESCHADLRIFSDGYACTDARSIALAAARAAKKDDTEACQPNDGRFTILRDAAEWMSRNAFAIEKLCVFFETPQQAAAALPRFRAVPGVEIVQGSPKNVEVTAAGVDKGEALRALADRLGVPHECTKISHCKRLSDSETAGEEWPFEGTVKYHGFGAGENDSQLHQGSRSQESGAPGWRYLPQGSQRGAGEEETVDPRDRAESGSLSGTRESLLRCSRK